MRATFSRPGARWRLLSRGRRRRSRVSRRPRAHARRHRGRRGARGEAHASLAAPPRPPRRTRSRRPLERGARALAARSVHADIPLRKHLRLPRGRWRGRAARERGGSLSRCGQGPVGGGSVGVQCACGRHGARGRPRRTGTPVPLRRAAAVQLGALVDPCRRPRGVPPPQAEAQRRDASRDDAGAIFGEDRGADSAASVSIPALVGRVRAALAASCGRGSARAGESQREGRRAREGLYLRDRPSLA